MMTVFFVAALAFLGLSTITYLRLITSSPVRAHPLAFRVLMFNFAGVLLALAAGISHLKGIPMFYPIAFVLLGLFIMGWVFIPKGWLTRVTGIATGIFTAIFTEAAEALPMLAELEWHKVLDEAQANWIQIGLAVAVILAYGRRK